MRVERNNWSVLDKEVCVVFVFLGVYGMGDFNRKESFKLEKWYCMRERNRKIEEKI